MDNKSFTKDYANYFKWNLIWCVDKCSYYYHGGRYNDNCRTDDNSDNYNTKYVISLTFTCKFTIVHVVLI